MSASAAGARTAPPASGPFLVVSLRNHSLRYFVDGEFVREFPIATGKRPGLTPQGSFRIVNKFVWPAWKLGDRRAPGGSPSNPLGSRWMGLSYRARSGASIGLHGTNSPRSIGRFASRGCLRMFNRDIEWLFARVPTGTRLVIQSGGPGGVFTAKPPASERPASRRPRDWAETAPPAHRQPPESVEAADGAEPASPHAGDSPATSRDVTEQAHEALPPPAGQGNGAAGAPGAPPPSSPGDSTLAGTRAEAAKPAPAAQEKRDPLPPASGNKPLETKVVPAAGRDGSPKEATPTL